MQSDKAHALIQKAQVCGLTLPREAYTGLIAAALCHQWQLKGAHAHCHRLAENYVLQGACARPYVARYGVRERGEPNGIRAAFGLTLFL